MAGFEALTNSGRTRDSPADDDAQGFANSAAPFVGDFQVESGEQAAL